MMHKLGQLEFHPDVICMPFAAATQEAADFDPCLGNQAGDSQLPRQRSDSAPTQVAVPNGKKTGRWLEFHLLWAVHSLQHSPGNLKAPIPAWGVGHCLPDSLGRDQTQQRHEQLLQIVDKLHWVESHSHGPRTLLPCHLQQPPGSCWL